MVDFRQEQEDGTIKQRPPSPGNFLSRCRNYNRFQKEMLSEHGKSFAKRVKLGIGAPTIGNPNEPVKVEYVDMGDYIR